MKAFEYANPASKEEAVKLLSAEAAVLAGGTDLLSLMKDYVVTPSRLVNIKSIKELSGVSYDAKKGLRIGALTTLDQLVADANVKREYPSLVQAADGVRSQQLQNMGTVGGDLCQRPRCWYYRAGFGLLALHNGKSLAPEGDNRYHAILGNEGPAYFVNPSSFAPALIALGATVTIFGSKGTRQVSLGKFYRSPKREGEREYALEPDEIVTEIVVPPTAGRKNATYEVRQKEALDWPLATTSVSVEMSGANVKSARIVMGHVAPTPWPAPDAEKLLAGKAITEETAAQAGEAAVRGAKPLSMNGYKVQLARVAVKRALLRASGKEVV